MSDSKKSAPKLIYESQESLYAKAVKMMEADGLIVQFAYKRENYLKAAEMFKEVGDYQDAPELEKKCRELAEQTREDEKEYSYQLAMTQQEDAKSAKGYGKAAKMFQSISDYKDSEKKNQECLSVMKKLKRKKKRKNTAVLSILLAIAAAAAFYFMSPNWENLKNRLLKKTENSSTANTTGSGEVSLEKAAAGDRVSFGSHVWYVLERDETRTKMIMFQAEKFEEFRHTPYHKKQEDVTWETCDLRKWLNSEFLESDFTQEEREKILTVEVKNAANSVYGTSGGKDTKDKVFLLSTDEVVEYNEILKQIRMNIWLRTPGKTSDTAAFMSSTGVPMEYGYVVTDTNFYTCPVICVSVE